MKRIPKDDSDGPPQTVKIQPKEVEKLTDKIIDLTFDLEIIIENLRHLGFRHLEAFDTITSKYKLDLKYIDELQKYLRSSEEDIPHIMYSVIGCIEHIRRRAMDIDDVIAPKYE